jgi:hypothetical protein
MKTNHMELRMMQRGISEDIIALVEKFGEFNERGDRIILSKKMIARMLHNKRHKSKA